MFKKIIVVALVSTMLGACASQGGGYGSQGGGSTIFSKENMGGVGGAVVGGVLGSNVGGGKGKLAATAVGAILGGLAGQSIGRSLDKADQMYANQAFGSAATAPIGQTINWNNPNSGNSGTVTPLRQGRTASGGVCRQFEQTIIIGGKAEKGVGTACQNSDGTWQITNS
jgi:surface antigen